MNIALQMKREDFPTTFCTTLTHFLRWRDGRDYQVTWNRAPAAGDGVLYIHPRLGIATPKWKSPHHFKFVWRELRSGKSKLESLARRAYVAAHLVPGPSRGWLASERVVISPRPPRFGDGFYVPGGHQLRWFDHRSGRCYVTVKRGFPSRFFEAQLDVRENHPVPAPRLFDVDRGARVFSEAILAGRAEIGADLETRKKNQRRALESLEPLTRATRESTNSRDYAGHLLSSIRSDASHLESELAAQVIAHAEVLADATPKQTMETALAHGDLHDGHIIVHHGAVTLIDWEHSSRRQVGHDALTLKMRPQLPGPFFAGLPTGTLPLPQHLLLLEALELTTRESNNPMLRGPTSGLLAVLRGLDDRRLPG